MKPFSVLMFLFAGMLLLMGGFIALGNGDIVKGYRFASIKDKKKYDRFFGGTVACCALAPLLCGLVNLVWSELPSLIVLVVVLVVVLVISSKKSKDYYK